MAVVVHEPISEENRRPPPRILSNLDSSDLVAGADVGVVEGRGRLGLLEEAALRGLVAGQIGREDLDRHLALEARVVGRVDDPHAAAAELGADRVRAEGGAWGEGHEVRPDYTASRRRTGSGTGTAPPSDPAGGMTRLPVVSLGEHSTPDARSLPSCRPNQQGLPA